MRRNQTYFNKKQINRKKTVWGILILLVLFFHMLSLSPAGIFCELVSQAIPVLTYSMEYGEKQEDYAASYEIPAWFTEDESSDRINSDIATIDSEPDDSDKTEKTTAMIDNKSKGTVYTREQLSKPDFLTSKIFVVDSNTSMTQEELDISNLMDTNLALAELPKGADTQYKVLIYHTHASESFADSRPGVKEDTVVGVGAYLAKLLNEQYGIPTYHDETTYDVIDGQLDRSKAYEKSYEGISRILKEYPSIEVVIDLHRDGVDEETHLVTNVDGKPTAKIMFLNGVSRSDMNGEIDYLQNPNKLMNLAFSFQLYLAGKENYGDYVRKIYVRSLRYNLHVMPRATLIEAGAQNNTIEEEMNAMEPLADMLDKVLRNSK